MPDLASSSARQPVPRLSIPGGLLLVFCLFLPAVKGCEKPVYPFELPPVYGPYLFGLLVAALAWFPARPKIVWLRFAAWLIATVSAAGEGILFLGGLLGPNVKAHRVLGPELVVWIPLFAVLLLSVRHRHDPERWRIQLLWTGGGLALLFFLSFLFTEKTYYGLWLSIFATLLLIIEGVWAASRPARLPPGA